MLTTKILAAAAALGILLGFVGIFYYYSMTLVRIADHPLVTNYARPEFPAHLAFGTSPLCGDHECWTEPGFDDSSWLKVALPKLEIKRLKGYNRGLKLGTVYYRMDLPIPENLLKTDRVIAFSPGWINHARFDIYLNGRLVYEGTGRTTNESLTSIPIPRADARKGRVSVVVKAQLTANDVGIRHHGGILVGPKDVLDEMAVSTERVNVTFFLLLFFSKGSIFVVFALVYIYTRAQRGFRDFLLYAFCVTIDSLFLMSSGLLDFNTRVLLYFTSCAAAVFALQRFFTHYYGIPRGRRTLLSVGWAMVVATVLLALDQGWLTKHTKLSDLFAVTNAMLVVTLAAAVAVGVVDLLVMRKNRVGGHLFKARRAMFLVVLTYLVLVVLDLCVHEYDGMDRRSILDLFFFFYMALANARSTGLNEGRIVTLEAHFEQKLRMEQELQDAAVISRALIPSEVPKWPFCDIAVFHRSLSESSGDWFAFETSPSGRFYHFILCDITGHGVQAAIIVSTCKTVLSGMAIDAPELRERHDFLLVYARRLGQLLYRQGGGQHTATFLGLTFEPAAARVHYVIGGHPPPYKLQGGQHAAVQPLVGRGSILGVSEAPSLTLRTETTGPGTEVVAFTDGIPLQSNVRAFRRFLSQSPVALNERPRRLFETVWQAHAVRTAREPDDDISIIWIRTAG